MLCKIASRFGTFSRVAINFLQCRLVATRSGELRFYTHTCPLHALIEACLSNQQDSRLILALAADDLKISSCRLGPVTKLAITIKQRCANKYSHCRLHREPGILVKDHPKSSAWPRAQGRARGRPTIKDLKSMCLDLLN